MSKTKNDLGDADKNRPALSAVSLPSVGDAASIAIAPTHSPGPWSVEFHSTPTLKQVVGPAFNIWYVWLATDVTEGMHRQRDCDAHLIAAAPDGYAANVAALDILERLGPPPVRKGTLPEEQDYDTAIRLLRAAIAKAQGR